MNPTFPTIMEIKEIIPQKCFRSDIITSLFFVIRILFISITLGILLTLSRLHMTSVVINVIYIYLQGLVFWGFFTIGHDCGHDAFSKYSTINWIVGNFLHSLILTPYEPWRLSHRSHHKNTNNIEKDEIFYPNQPIKHVYLTYGIGIAWFFYILLKNVPGRRNYLAYFTSDFTKYRAYILTSFVSIGLVLYLITKAINTFGWLVVILYYGAPLFVFACWLVVFTFLHHNNENCPWYENENWTYVKGALSSIDRDYGYLVNNLAHSSNLHQIHHLFPKIPHYHLQEATVAFRKAFPKFVRTSNSNFLDFVNGISSWKTKIKT